MDNKEKSPEKELIESIGLMIEKGMESNTNIYTGVVKSVDGKRAVVAVNGQNQNVSIATADVSSGNVVRVFVPEGNMSAAFIIKAEASGGGGTTTTAYGDLTGKPQINGVTLVDNKTSKELNLYGTGNAPPYPVTSVNGQTGDVTIEVGGNVDSVNGKTGAVVLSAADVGAISTGNISQTLGTSTTKVPSEKAVSDALSSAGAGDMLKSTYDPTGSVATAGGIPEYVEANGGKIDTIKVNGTAQVISDKTVNITVPTKTSDITNDSGYLTSVPVTSVNSKTGAIVLTANDVGALPADTVIPTVNNATLTIRRNSVDIGSFTANSSNDVNIDINVPTDKSDIGLGNVDNVKQYSASNPPPYPVTSVNGKTGDVTVHEVPTVTTTDNGKFLRVVNGEWAAVAIADANGVKF